MSDSREQLKAVLQDLINDRPEDATETIHDYIVAKTQELAGLTEAAQVKAYKIKLPAGCKKTEDGIFGREEGDDSFIQNQSVVTVEYVELKGSTLYVYPAFADEYSEKTAAKLQTAFDRWCSK